MIYFIQCGGRRGPVKIGFTEKDQSNHRLLELQTATPYALKVLGEMPGRRADEKRIHGIFNASRIGGEWFKYSEQLSKFIELSCNPHLANELDNYHSDVLSITADNMIKMGFDLPLKLEEIERAFIYAALSKSNWVQARAAMMLNIGKSGLNQKIKKYDIKLLPKS